MLNDDLPKAEFGWPGPLRDQLVAAILSGAKTSTTGLLAAYQVEDEPLPRKGERNVVVDSDDLPVAIIEVTDVRIARLGDVDLAHAIDEGEGDATVASWRVNHESFFHSPEMRDILGQPDFTVDDDTLVVLERFRLIEIQSAESSSIS